jgi:hypothetical protein
MNTTSNQDIITVQQLGYQADLFQFLVNGLSFQLGIFLSDSCWPITPHFLPAY